MPNYKQIYTDIINRKYPEKWDRCATILSKTELTTLDIIKLNEIIFSYSDRETTMFNQQHKSYDEKTIINMLIYQQKNEWNNTQLANYFKLSRNSVAKWKKIYKV
ncbi:helix-turn-helix domain-containing protein [Chryseobacterium sp. DT-3]|uniref:helix-turn-helix domain-containing protein n=1 Tax=Chryseobacterium sp. DT-3 TaxID=3396164 RepID=UPI003F1C0FC5